MKKITVFFVGLIIMMTALGCGEKVDPNMRRGDMFLGNKKFAEAIKAYEATIKSSPAALEDDAFKQRFKDAYYYKGGEIELSAEDDPEILSAAYPYYEKGFDLWPKEVGMCDKIAKYYWAEENFEKAAKFFEYLVEFDAEIPETDKNKWNVLHEDYYALGYSLFQTKQYKKAKEALEQSIKANKKGSRIKQARSALDAVKQKMKK